MTTPFGPSLMSTFSDFVRLTVQRKCPFGSVTADAQMMPHPGAAWLNWACRQRTYLLMVLPPSTVRAAGEPLVARHASQSLHLEGLLNRLPARLPAFAVGERRTVETQRKLTIVPLVVRRVRNLRAGSDRHMGPRPEATSLHAPGRAPGSERLLAQHARRERRGRASGGDGLALRGVTASSPALGVDQHVHAAPRLVARRRCGRGRAAATYVPGLVLDGVVARDGAGVPGRRGWPRGRRDGVERAPGRLGLAGGDQAKLRVEARQEAIEHGLAQLARWSTATTPSSQFGARGGSLEPCPRIRSTPVSHRPAVSGRRSGGPPAPPSPARTGTCSPRLPDALLGGGHGRRRGGRCRGRAGRS